MVGIILDFKKLINFAPGIIFCLDFLFDFEPLPLPEDDNLVTLPVVCFV